MSEVTYTASPCPPWAPTTEWPPARVSRKPGAMGAVTFSWTGDPSSGEFRDAKVIRKFGEVPEDLSVL